MNVKKRGNVSLFLISLLILTIISLGCSGAKKQVSKGDSDMNRAVKIQSSLDRISKTLKLNPDGTVSMDDKRPDYVSLNRGDLAFGKSLLASLNTMVRDGLVRVNRDITVEWLITRPMSSQLVGKTNCTTHFWGETCLVDSSTTKKVCTGLEAGEGALIICGFIPVVDVACEIIEAIGAIPLEAEICPCADRGKSSNFHVTWIGAAWFTCN